MLIILLFSFNNDEMDQQLQILINREWVSPWCDHLLSLVSDFGAWALWIVLLLILGLFYGTFRFRAAILAAGLAVGLCDGLAVNLLKHTVNRPRPLQVEPGVRVVRLGEPSILFLKPLSKITGVFSEPFIYYPNGMEAPEIPGMLTSERPRDGRSFPSGHAANNMAVAVVLLLFFPRWGWLYLPVALLISYSRIYTGSHWPLDVLAGMILGAAGGWIATRLLQLIWRKLGPRLAPHLARKYPDLLSGKSP